MVDKVLTLRLHRFPRWGEGKLVVLLRQEGLSVSTSVAGHVLAEMKMKGVLR